ncbi:hypothetical protein LCGC14_0445800 [marine sediment metagenome]|uniref:Uncharacterized protein n=1 Tax=marine sediment metagenome TaxID=412755 RepID=A0A0F9VT54_9ZZZZ
MSVSDVVLVAVTIVGYAVFSSLLLWEAWISWRRRK